MILARLLIATLLLWSLSAFAQDLEATLPATQPAPNTRDTAVTRLEQWKIVPNQPTDATSEKSPMDRIRIDQFKVDRNGRPFNLEAPSDPMVIASPGQPGDDVACYAIRSYVVARDRKGSDATHLVGYSTCVPSSRYRVKRVEMPAPSVTR